MLTEDQKTSWRAMVKDGDRQGLVNAVYHQNLVLSRFYRMRCQRFTLEVKLEKLASLIRQRNDVKVNNVRGA